MIDGVEIKMGGTAYIVPPLTFKQIRNLESTLASFGNIDDSISGEQMNQLIKVAHMALSRNYPDLTAEELEDLIDLGNAASIMHAVMGASGLKKAVAEVASQ